MIDAMVTISVNGELLTMFGTVCEADKSISLNYRIYSKAIDDLNLLYHPKVDFPIVDTGVNQYSVYGCKFLTQSTSLGTGTVHLEGTFTRLLKERQLGCEYDSVRFRFDGIEQIFPLEKFSTQDEAENQLLTFTKEQSVKIEYLLPDSIQCSVESEFIGTKSSSHMYDLHLTQNKVITCHFPEKRSIDIILSYVDKIKKYFEFLLQQEIKLSKIVCFNQASPGLERAVVLADSILDPKTFIKKIKEKPYRSSIDDLFVGLIGWLQEYEKYRGLIDIWQKTIYNTNVSEDDLFIWRCQAFELLCTINSEIYTKALSYKDKHQSNPNLKNFLTAIKNLYDIVKVDNTYFRDVKDVRDKLTHNNPKKSVSETQKKNSREVINMAFLKTYSKIANITGIPSSMILSPTSEKT